MAWTPPITWVDPMVVDEDDMNEQIRDNLKELWHRIAYVEFTADVAITATEAAPTDIVSAGAVTFTGSNLCRVDVWCPAVSFGNGTGHGVSLWDGGTDIGELTAFSTSSYRVAPFSAQRFLTPSSGSHTYKARGWSDATLTASAGAGGAGNKVPGFIAIWQRG